MDLRKGGDGFREERVTVVGFPCSNFPVPCWRFVKVSVPTLPQPS